MALRHPPPFALPPEQPAHVYTLEALLQGCLVASHALTAPLTLLGRDADACAVALTDASASRVHCALAYNGATQQLYACDQGSANGTFLQKRRMEAGAWVALAEGAQLRCGTDARVFVVSAPAGLAAAAQQQQQQQQRQQPPAAAEGAEVVVGIVAGDEAEAASEGGGGGGSGAPPLRLGQRASSGGGGGGGGIAGAPAGHWLASLDWVGLTDKEREAVKKLQAKLQRLGALRLEAARIQAKEASQAGLSEGQLAQLAKLQDSIGALVEVLEEEDGSLRQRIEGRRNPGAGGAAAGGGAQERERELPSAWLRDSEEDVKDVSMLGFGGARAAAAAAPAQRRAFTFTARPPPAAAAAAPRAAAASAASAAAAAAPPAPLPHLSTGAVETHATLSSRLTAIRRRLMELRESEAEAGAEAVSLSTAAGGASTDALDVFVDSAASKDALAWLARMRVERGALEQEQARLQQLLALVRPALLEEEAAVAAAVAEAAPAAAQGGSGAGQGAGGAAAPAPAAPAAPAPAARTAANVLSQSQPMGLATLLESVSGGDSHPPPAKRPRPAAAAAAAAAASAAADSTAGTVYEPPAQGYDAEPEDLTRFH